jgi:hypothetical protein
MSNKQQRQLDAILRQGQFDPLGNVEWSGQIGCQYLGDRGPSGPSGRAARTARACR